MNKSKKHLIDGKYYSINQLITISGKTRYTVSLRLKNNASTLHEITTKVFIAPSPNWSASMMNDLHGHWKLLAKVLRC